MRWSTSTWYADGRGFDPHVWQHSFVEFVHEIISTAILSFPLIQGGQLSVIGERMCTTVQCRQRKQENTSYFSPWSAAFFSGRNRGKFLQEILHFLQEIPVFLPEILRFCLQSSIFLQEIPVFLPEISLEKLAVSPWNFKILCKAVSPWNKKCGDFSLPYL